MGHDDYIMVLGAPCLRSVANFPLILFIFNQADNMFGVEDEILPILTTFLLLLLVFRKQIYNAYSISSIT